MTGLPVGSNRGRERNERVEKGQPGFQGARKRVATGYFPLLSRIME